MEEEPSPLPLEESVETPLEPISLESINTTVEEIRTLAEAAYSGIEVSRADVHAVLDSYKEQLRSVVSNLKDIDAPETQQVLSKLPNFMLVILVKLLASKPAGKVIDRRLAERVNPNLLAAKKQAEDLEVYLKNNLDSPQKRLILRRLFFLRQLQRLESDFSGLQNQPSNYPYSPGVIRIDLINAMKEIKVIQQAAQEVIKFPTGYKSYKTTERLDWLNKKIASLESQVR